MCSAIEGKLNPKTVTAGGAPALHFTHRLDRNDEPGSLQLVACSLLQHGNFSMGLANIELKRGTATSVAARPPPAAQPDHGCHHRVKRSISKNQSSRLTKHPLGDVRKGGRMPPKVRLVAPENYKGRVVISSGASEAPFHVAGNLGRELAIAGTPFTLWIENYWSDFRIENGKPDSVSEEPEQSRSACHDLRQNRSSATTAPNPHGNTNRRPPVVRRRCRTWRRSTKSPHIVHR